MSTDVATGHGDGDITGGTRLMRQRHLRRRNVPDLDNTLAGGPLADDLNRGPHEPAGAILKAAETIP